MTGYAGQALLDALDAGDLTDWQGLPDGIAARFATGDFATGLALVQDIAALAEDANHHPDLTLTYPAVGVRLISHDVGAVTDRDFALARAISDVARERGVDADPRAPQVIELGLDTADASAIAPFWAALLTGDAANVVDGHIIDPTGQAPRLWFQSADPHDVPRQRLHVDVSVPAAEAGARIRAAVAAGGRIVDESHQPLFTVLEDADGNRACVCTIEGR